MLSVLAIYRYDSTGASTLEAAGVGPVWPISSIPAASIAFAALVLLLYPLNERKTAAIDVELAERCLQSMKLGT